MIIQLAVFFSVLLQSGECQETSCSNTGNSTALLRLVNGGSNAQGNVEVRLNATSPWGTVCDRGWDIKDATVACHQLGFTKALAATVQSSFGTGSGRIWLDNVQCTGNENSINECTRGTWGRPYSRCRQYASSTSSYYGISGVVCAVNKDDDVNLRLVGGSNKGLGQVQVGFRDVWGHVCDNNWDKHDAAVVCRQLGYQGTIAATVGSAFWSGPTYRIWLRNVHCFGEENSLRDCRHDPWGSLSSSSCGLAGVVCDDGGHNNITVRLIGGVTERSGRVEIGFNNTWGSVCDANWNIHNALVVCRMLGHSRALAATMRSSFSRGTGRIWLDNVDCIGTEGSITMCSHSGWGVVSSYCSHSREAGVVCGETMQVDVRLQGGVNQSHGRVEIGLDGAWGTICDNNWDIRDARVVCRMLGYPTAVAATLRSSFVKRTGRMWLDNVACTGIEASIDKCPYIVWGVVSSYCSNSKEAGVACGETTQVDIQLNGQVNQSHGRVEIGFNGAWGEICDENWDIHDAHVVCRMLGYPTALAATLRSSFVRGTGRMWLTNVACTGTEDSIDKCSHSEWGVLSSSCTHSREVGVVCGDYTERFDIKLIGGLDQSQGRIEIGLKGAWGTVCDTNFDIHDANVVCRQLGYGKALVVASYPLFGVGTGRIWLDTMNCRGDEQHIGDCQHGQWGLTSCSHSTDNSAICGEHNETIEVHLADGISNKMGRVEISFHGLWGTVCDTNWDIHDAHVVCRQLGYDKALVATINSAFGKGVGNVWGETLNCRGEETKVEDCNIRISSPSGSCRNHAEDVGVVCTDELSIQLVGGNGISNGQVQIGFDKHFWGAICATDWSYEDATVLCRMMGFEKGLPTFFASTVGPVVDRYWLSEVNCNGDERSIIDCANTGWNVPCSSNSHAGVICLGPSYPPEIRLVGGDGVSNGFVEIGFNGTWGKVCPTNWDLPDAQVVCRMLGYKYALAATGGDIFGRTLARRYWINSVECRGNELSIIDCPSSGWVVSCANGRIAGVICTDTMPRTDIRLIGGKDESQGRVELGLNGVWGTVCHESWDIHDAEVVCRQLGYSGAIAATIRGPSSFTAGAGRIWATNFACKGEEQSLLDCGHSAWGVHSCDHTSDAGVVCQADNVTNSDIKLERGVGDSTGQGRVLVGLNGAWGAICSYGWDLNDAHVVCRQLGFNSAVSATTSAKYGTWTGRMWLRNLGCTGSEDSLLNCTHDGWGISDTDTYRYRYYSSWYGYRYGYRYYTCDRNTVASITCNYVIPLEKRVTVSSLPERIISGPGSTVNMTCTFHGVDLQNFTVKWSINGTLLESQASFIKSHFTLFTVDNSSVLQIRRGSSLLSGAYQCSLQNHSLISASSNVTFAQGCPPAPLRPTSSVGHSVTIPCSHVHASFNPQGRVKWTCTDKQLWEGDLSSCTFNDQKKEILILSVVFNKSLADYNDNMLLVQIRTHLNSALQTSIENLTISNKRILSDYDTTVVNVVIQTESPVSSILNSLRRLDMLHLTFDAIVIAVSVEEKLVIKPSDKCRCPAKFTSPSRELVTLEVCNAPYYVRSPCKCEANGTCSCSGVYVQKEGLCWLDTDGDGIPNSEPDPCEGCCLPSFDRGFQWPRTSHGLEVSYSCKTLNPLLSDFSRIRRQCNTNGHWGQVDFSGCTFKSTDQKSILFIEVNVSLSVTGVMNVEDDLFSKLRAAASSYNLGEFEVVRYYPWTENITLIALSVDVQRDDIVDATMALESTEVDVMLTPPVVYSFRPSVYCRCSEEKLSIDKNTLTLCTGPGSTPCECKHSSGQCMCSDPYIDILLEGVLHCSLDTDGDGIPDFRDLNPNLYDGSKQDLGCVATSPSTDNCPDSLNSGILWPSTPPCEYSIQRCTRKSDNATAFNIGLAKRFCNSNGMWEMANVTDCESKAFREARVIIDELRESTLNTPVAIEGGIQPVEEDQVALFTSTTSSLTSEAKRLADNSESLFPRDLGTAVTYVETVSEASIRTNLLKQDLQQGMKIFGLVDNILNSQHIQAWDSLSLIESSRAPNLLFNSEKLASSLTNSLLIQSENLTRTTFREMKSVNVTLNNIVVNGGIIDVKSELLSSNLLFTGSPEQDTIQSPSIKIPKALLNERSNGETVQVVNMQINGLSELLQKGVNEANQTGVNRTALQNINETTQNGMVYKKHSCNSISSCHLGSIILSSQVGSNHEYSQTPMDEPVVITFPMESYVENAKCVFWNFPYDSASDGGNLHTGKWSDEGLTTVIEKDTVVCKSTHLTSFAVLVDVSGSTNQFSADHRLALSIVTYIGCSLSLIALIITIIYFISLRKQLITQIGNFVHLNMCLALTFGLVTFIVGSEGATSSQIACNLVTTLLHYFFLSLFFWMLCEGIHLFRMTVIVFHVNKKKWLLYYSIIGWIIPSIIAAISVAAKHDLYRIPISYDKENPDYHNIRACWLPTEDGIIAAFIAPMLCVILVNVVIIIIALKKIYRSSHVKLTEASDDYMKTSALKAMKLLKSIAVLLPLTGLTWIFGLLAVNSITSFFTWGFLVLNSLQGVFIFICLVVRHDEVRNKFKTFCNLKREKRSSDTDAVFHNKVSGEAMVTMSMSNEQKNLDIDSKTAPNEYEVHFHSTHGQRSEDDVNEDDQVSIQSKGDEMQHSKKDI